MEKKEMWYALPDSLLVQVFSHLNAFSLVQAGAVCQSWHRVSCDELLWKKLFHRDWKIDQSIPIAPGKTSWKSEYKRLKHHTPVLESEVLTDHTHQVLHVSFSHNGDMFASCSKDGYVKVWNTTFPAFVRYSSDMKMYSWNYTQFSQFNESDTLLLVSGVHFGAHTASGEIAVFNLSDCFTLQCRVLNKPYDIFGTWYTDDYLLAGRLHFLGHFISCSALWLNKAWQESDSEKKQIVKRLFKFYNKSASSIRTIMIANCLQSDESSAEESNGGNKPILEYGQRESSTLHQLSEQLVKGNPVSHNALSTSQWPVPNSRRRQRSTESSSMDVKVDFNAECQEACTVNSPIRYSLEYRRVESAREGVDSDENDDNNSTNPDFEDPPLPWDEDWFELSEEDGSEVSNKINGSSENFRDNDVESEKEEKETVDSIEEDLSGEKLLDPREKYLIFTTGSLTYTPHQIGFKRIKPFKFAEQVTETATLSQRIQERREKRNAPSVSPNWQDEHAIADHFDKVDHIIDLHGHIIGMGLSPDHRYLYVNSRPWPQNYVIEQPLFPPPIAQEIDIHVIDLVTLKEVGTMLRSHKAYTPNDECFFIFLDVSQQYVASGAEDKHGYLWDRHYGNCLAKLPHTDVVNSVAFNPADNEMLVTASDDYTMKIWRSKSRIQHLNIQNKAENSISEINTSIPKE